jgi:cytochrome P450
MAGGIGSELPIVQWIGERLPFQAAQELFAGNQIIETYGRAAVANMKAAGGSKNIFSNMMAEAEKGERLDDRDVELEATNLIIAGTDTTAISLTYMVYAVLKQPALLRDVVSEVVTLSQDFGDEDLEKLPLLNAIIKETSASGSENCYQAFC